MGRLRAVFTVLGIVGCTVAVVASPWAARPARAASVTTHVILLLGQSNMSGRGSDYSSTLDPSNPRIKQYTAAGVLTEASEPLGHPDPATKGGPGLAFAREYLTTLPANDQILLIPASYGGTGFSTPDSNGGNLSWDVTKANTNNNLYERSLTQLRNGIAALGSAASVQIDGALFNLGDTDGLNHVSGPDYQNYLDALIKGYRARLNLPNLPFVLGPSRPDAIAGNSWYRGINAIQIATPGRVAHTAYIPGAVGDQYYNSTDLIHYNQVGNRAMGLQYAHALVGIISGLPTLAMARSFKLSRASQSSMLDLSWTAVAGATGYRVGYKASASSAWNIFGTTAGLDIQIGALTASTYYDFAVQPTDGSNTLGPVNATLTASTPAQSNSYIDAVKVDAARAYGLRKLSDAYTGPAITVRRSSDNALQDIGFKGSALDTASLLSFTGSSSAYIKTWFDQSGNAQDLTQTASARQACIVTNGVINKASGKPTAVFDGANDYYSDTQPSLYAAAAASLSVVSNAPSSSTAADIVNESNTNSAGGSNSYRMLRSNSNTLGFQVINSAGTSVVTGSNGTLFDNASHVSYIVDTGSHVSSFIDSTAGLKIDYTRSGTVSVNDFNVGATVQKTTYDYYAGDISEIVAWSGALTDVQRQAGGANQKSYYGTP